MKRNRFAEMKLSAPIYLDDVAKVFDSSEAVNTVLRSAIRAMRGAGTKRPSRRILSKKRASYRPAAPNFGHWTHGERARRRAPSPSAARPTSPRSARLRRVRNGRRHFAMRDQGVRRFRSTTRRSPAAVGGAGGLS